MATRSKAGSKPSALCEELIEALLDPRLVEALGKALAPAITKSVDDAVAPLVKQIEGLSATVKELKAENVRLAKRCETAENAYERLDKIAADHCRRLEDIEAYSRSDNLIIRGLPERTASERATDAPPLDGSAPTLRESHESVEANVLHFFNATLGVSVLPQDISVTHRLKPSAKDKVRPVIVKFVNRKARNNVYQSQNGAQGDRELNLYRRTSNEGHLRSVLRSTEASERRQNIWSLDPEWSGLRAVLTRQNCPCYSRAFRQGPGTEALDNDFIIAVLTGNDSYIVFCLAVPIFFSVMHPWALGTRQVFSYGIING
jgi:hypothetical protein